MNAYLYAVKDKDNLCKRRDYVMLTLDGISLYSNETADHYTAQGYEIFTAEQFRMLWNECWAVYESELCGKWIEITAERYDEMLNVLPPMRWTNGGFFLSELYDGNIGYFFQQWGGRYYESMQNVKNERINIINELQTCLKEGTFTSLYDVG
jgi:hypothetical protein